MKITLNGEERETTPSTTPSRQPDASSESTEVKGDEKTTFVRSGHHSYRLEQLAYLRSGDKGNTANIGKEMAVEPPCMTDDALRMACAISVLFPSTYL